MERLAKGILVIGGIFLIALLSIVGYVQLRSQVNSGSLRRQAEPRLFFGEGQSEVTFARLAQPAVDCPAVRRSTNIALLLDKSGSMADNNAMTTALEAARLFVTDVDLNVARVSVISFDEFTTIVQSATQDGNLLQAALSTRIEPVGGTDIAGALQEVGRVLRMTESPTTAVPIIILLTDGGSDSRDALQVGQQLKDEGVRIVAISLLTIDSDPDLLRALASSPADYYETPSPGELEAIYTRLAEGLNTAVAFNVAITETVNSNFNVIPNSLQPNGVVTSNQVVWQLPGLPNNEAAFTYQVVAAGWGLHRVNEEPTTMSYTDCIAGTITTSLMAGPDILVLPPIWLLGLLAILPFLPLLSMAWFKRPKQTPFPEPLYVSPVEPDPPPDPYPAWLKRLDDSRKTLVANESVMPATDLTDTMIIGIGPVGRVVLTQMAQTLRARYGGRLPTNVRLLQIDVQPKDASALNLSCPAYLEAEEWVLLEPDLIQVSDNLQRAPQDWPHLDWYEATAMEEYGRARGRMALFYDLKDGADRSVLWRSLSRTAAQLNHPRLRLVGSTFDDTSSGMLTDVAWLIQMITQSSVDVELWLSGPLNQTWSPRLHNPRQQIQVNEQKARTLATLRELERLQRNATVPFYYVSANNVQTQFRKTSEATAVVQTLFLFTPADEETDIEDHLATIADSLLAVLHKPAQQTVNDHLNRSETPASNLTNRDGLGMVCSLGAYSVRMPLGLLEEALTWRMAQEILFEAQIGLLPLLRLLPEGDYEALEVDDLPDNAASRRDAAANFVQRYRRRWYTADFSYALARQVGDILNGEAQEKNPSLDRAGGLVKAIRWLESVRNHLNIEGELGAAQAVNGLRQQLLDWQTFLMETVLPLVQQRWQESRHNLEQLLRQSGRQWAVPSGLEWPIYRERVRSWLDSPPPTLSSEQLVRAAQRFGWHVAYRETGREWQTQLWLPPGDFVWEGPDSLWDVESFIQRQDGAAFAGRLYQLIAPLARNRASAEYALDQAEKLDKRFWLDQASPRLPINAMEASRLMDFGGGVRELAVLVAPKSTRALQLEGELRATPGAPSVELSQTEDQTAVTLLRIRDRVPLATYEQGYGPDAWQSQFVPPGLYVWRGEQLAAGVESDKRLSSLFVGWLELDPQLVDLFARAYLFSLLDSPGRNELELPGLGSWSGEKPGDGLANLFSRDETLWPAVFLKAERRTKAIHILTQAIGDVQEAIWRDPGKRVYLRQAEEKLIVPLQKSKDRRERDLAIYLQGIIKQL